MPSGVLLLKFLRTAFRNDPFFAEIVCACHLVYSLESPADALYLLQPVDKTIPESVGAWSVSAAHSDADWVLPVRRDLMIRAMRAFANRGAIYDWLDWSDLWRRRTMQQWVEFAGECMSNHRFTARWWSEQGEWGETMGGVILKRAEAELERLDKALWRDECRRMMCVKRERREAQPKKDQTMRSLSSSGNKPLKLAVLEEASAKANSEQLSLRHRNLLKEIGKILDDRISTHTFDTKLAKIARCVMSVANEYKHIKWALKALFHKAAGDRLGMELWHMERLLCLQAAFRARDPLDKLRRIR